MKSLSFGLLYLFVVQGCSSETGGPNLPPVAVAGPDQEAAIGRTLNLDGTASYDPDGDPVRFEWELIAARPQEDGLVELAGFREPKAQITVRAPGTWLIRLTVDDGRLKSPPDIVRIRVPAGPPCEQDSDCDDGDPCNGSETCVDDACRPGLELDCDDHNDCTDDACDPLDGCGHTPNSADCADGDPCTVNDACDQGVCTGQDKATLTLADGGCDDGIACTEDLCDPLDGSCSHTPMVGPCDDQDPCTLNDECDQTGVCSGIDRAPLPVDQGGCDLGDPCSEPSCDSSDGSCLYSDNSAPCDDGDPCTKQDTCNHGACAGSPYTCDDGNLCNGTESCHPDEDTCLPGENLPDSAYCQGDDLVVCDGQGAQIGITTCLMGCNPAGGSQHCRDQIIRTFGENTTSTNSNDFTGVTEDVSVDSVRPETNYDTGWDQDGHIITDDVYLWIRFDISSLPADAEIETVQLYLYSRWRQTNSISSDQVYEVAAGTDSEPAREWLETEATWDEYRDEHPWTGGADGGEQDRGEVLSTQTVPLSMVYDWTSWEFNPAGVAYFQDRLGGEINLTVYGTVATHTRQYMATEGADGSRPVLRIVYVW